MLKIYWNAEMGEGEGGVVKQTSLCTALGRNQRYQHTSQSFALVLGENRGVLVDARGVSSTVLLSQRRQVSWETTVHSSESWETTRPWASAGGAGPIGSWSSSLVLEVVRTCAIGYATSAEAWSPPSLRRSSDAKTDTLPPH